MQAAWAPWFTQVRPTPGEGLHFSFLREFHDYNSSTFAIALPTLSLLHKPEHFVWGMGEKHDIRTRTTWGF